jgi:hypothetical protein
MTRSTLWAAVAVAGLVVSACASTSTPKARQDSTNVPFKSCDKVQCADTLNGAAYQIVMPKNWNGTLLLYSHGYRQAQAAPPDNTPPSTKPDPAPGWSDGSKDVGNALLAKGYALAGSAYASNGWAVADGVKADEDLYAYFTKNVGQPYRTYVWGDSLGGLVTEVLAEKDSSWVSGAAPLCGVLGGPVANLDLALDVAYAMKLFFNPALKLTGFSSWAEATQQWSQTAAIVQADLAGPDQGAAAAKLLTIAALVDAPGQTMDANGATVTSKVKATAEAVLTALGYATFGRYDIEQRFGGNPSDNTKTNYALRVNSSERSLIDVAGGAGTTDKLLAELAAAPRLAADPAAVTKFAASGTPTGAVVVPTITMHTTADPLVIVQNETLFAQRYAANPKRTADLLQLFIAPPADPAAWAPNAPYGAGHCNFTGSSRIAIIGLLDNWVRDGVYPGTAAVAQAMGTDSGYSPTATGGPWPDPTVK